MPRTAAASTYPARAIVLRVRPLGEKDRVMTLLSPEWGKFSASARGARGPKSKLAAVSQPFMLARFLFAHGRSLDIATQAEIENAHTHLSLDLLKTAWATYLCELCDAVPEQLPDAELFDLLSATLAHLDAAPPASPDIEIIGYWFEARFVALLGYAPTIGRCPVCERKIVVPLEDTSQRLAFSPTLGGTLCGSCLAHDPQRLTVGAPALRAWHKLERAGVPPPAVSLDLIPGARRDLRDCLRRSLRLHLDLKLKSQSFLEDVATSQLMAQNDV